MFFFGLERRNPELSQLSCEEIYKERKSYYEEGRGSELPSEERVPTPAEAGATATPNCWICFWFLLFLKGNVCYCSTVYYWRLFAAIGIFVSSRSLLVCIKCGFSSTNEQATSFSSPISCITSTEAVLRWTWSQNLRASGKLCQMQNLNSKLLTYILFAKCMYSEEPQSMIHLRRVNTLQPVLLIPCVLSGRRNFYNISFGSWQLLASLSLSFSCLLTVFVFVNFLQLFLRHFALTVFPQIFVNFCVSKNLIRVLPLSFTLFFCVLFLIFFFSCCFMCIWSPVTRCISIFNFFSASRSYLIFPEPTPLLVNVHSNAKTCRSLQTHALSLLQFEASF